MNPIIAILAIVITIGIAGLALLALVICGIRGDERHMSLRDIAPTRASLIARRVLGAYSSPHK
jgi:hypothetical protein